MKYMSALSVLVLLAADPGFSADATTVLTKDDVTAAIGAMIKEVRADSDKKTVRYFAVDGKPFQEAVIVAVNEAASGTYEFALANAKKTSDYKRDVAGFGDKAFWEEAGPSYGVLHVVSGKTYVMINVGQSKAPQTYFDVAKSLMTLALKRL
jgi:hypothetical protein